MRSQVTQQIHPIRRTGQENPHHQVLRPEKSHRLKLFWPFCSIRGRQFNCLYPSLGPCISLPWPPAFLPPLPLVCLFNPQTPPTSPHSNSPPFFSSCFARRWECVSIEDSFIQRNTSLRLRNHRLNTIWILQPQLSRTKRITLPSN